MRARFRKLRSAGKRSGLSPAMSSSIKFEFDLLSLPEELICLVIEHVEVEEMKMGSLERLARTCKTLQRLAEPKLYRHHKLRSGHDGESLMYSLGARKARASHIHTLAYHMSNEFAQNFETLRGLLGAVPHLKEFSFQSPECSTNDFEEEEEWQAMANPLFQPFVDASVSYHPPMVLIEKPLQMLNKLTLHMNGIESPYWNFDAKSRAIFFLPSLQHLHVSCVNILDDLADDINRTFFSPLKHLTIEEGNFTHQGLHHLLSFPKALETFDLLENCHNVNVFTEEALHPSWNQLFKNNPAATMAALSQQSDSLISLVYATTKRGYELASITSSMTMNRTPVDGAFTRFHKLEAIKLVGKCANFERAVLSSRSPPNLKVLAVEHQYPLRRYVYNYQPQDDEALNAMDFAPFFRAPSSSMPDKFEKLELTYTLYSPDDSNHILSIARELQRVGATLNVIWRARNSFFPPYLDGEPRPEDGDDVVFDGKTMVFGPGFNSMDRNDDVYTSDDFESSEEDGDDGDLGEEGSDVMDDDAINDHV